MVYGWPIKDLKDFLTSDRVVFYIQVFVFFAMVFILPMIPMLMFIFTENQPSINPDVYKELFKNAQQKTDESRGKQKSSSIYCFWDYQN